MSEPALHAVPSLSIIIPFLEDREALARLGSDLADCDARAHELIVVDGGSSPATLQWLAAQPWIDRLLSAPRGRAVQMNAGARIARGEMFWFLHADTRIPREWRRCPSQCLPTGRVWGRFDVRLSGAAVGFRVIEFMMNRRSCITGIATGDQGIFVHRELFRAVQGFPELPLMEDIALSRSLKRRHGRPLCQRPRIVTSSRRWEQHGILRTVLLMWTLRLGFWMGIPTPMLARWYT